MSDPITTDQCRAAQRECSQRIFATIEQLRRETKEDVGLIREAVQSIDRAVSAVKGYLGLNGNAGPVAPHPHRRDTEELERLHSRIGDLIEKAEALHKTNTTKSDQSITIPRWVLVPVGIFIIIVLAIAMVAGERGLTFLPKTSSTQSLVVPK